MMINTDLTPWPRDIGTFRTDPFVGLIPESIVLLQNQVAAVFSISIIRSLLYSFCE